MIIKAIPPPKVWAQKKEGKKTWKQLISEQLKRGISKQ